MPARIPAGDRTEEKREKMDILPNIQSPEDLKSLSLPELEQLAGEIRQEIIDTVAENGGHLASNLGIVDLTVALHRVFDSPKDKLIFDVGHQTYAHKLLTGRQSDFHTLRTYGGMSGFPRRSESVHDVFDTGHSATAISAALGLARARDIRGEDYHVVAVVGDGALTGGMCYEAMNDAGNFNEEMGRSTRLIVVLNDNEMSISRNVGAMANHLTKLRASASWRGTKLAVKKGITRIPLVGPRAAKRLEKMKNALKHFWVHGEFFESLGFRYLGPIDGHDIAMMEHVLAEAKQVTDTPLLIHVITCKGRGYERAERRPEKYHGIAPFFLEDGAQKSTPIIPATANVVGDTLCAMADADDQVVAITAAMASGTGLIPFERKYKERFFDVGIAEEHAVTMAAGLARGGMKPYFAVYSTFLQRAYDQIFHDICLQDLPVRLLVDHAGLVGSDGKTHHGVFDLSMLSAMPGLSIWEASDNAELSQMLFESLKCEGPLAIRYIKDGIDLEERCPGRVFEPGKWQWLQDGEDGVLIAHGRMVQHALKAAQRLRVDGKAFAVVNASTLKPLDVFSVERALSGGRPVFTVEENISSGSLGQALSLLCVEKGFGKLAGCFSIGDRFVTHGSMRELLTECGLMPEQIASRVQNMLSQPHNI